jgi:pimeloyl-ACP methyl ester carboxylesterase
VIQAEKRRIRTSGGEISYVDVGDGPAVLLLHGFPLSSFTWRELIPLLETRFRVVVPDLLGAGDSDKPEDAPLHIRAQAGYVRELLAGIGIERFAVVGASHGGGVAQLLAIEGAGVDAMVLLNPICFDHWPSDQIRQVQANEPGGNEDERLAYALLRAGLDISIRQGRLDEAVVDEYFRPYRGEQGARAFFRSIRAIDGIGLSGREPDLARLEIPVMILWGEDDAFMPVAAAERLSEAIPTSTLGLVPGCGHLLFEDAAATIGPMIYEYLRARYLREPHGHGDGEVSGIVTIQLERRPPWVDLAEYEEDD